MPIEYSLEMFLADMTRLVERRPDEDALLNEGKSHLERLIANPECVPEKYCSTIGRGSWPNHGTYILHRGSELYVTAVVWGPGDSIGPHNHNTWGMIGVARNAIQETRWVRSDGREGAGPAKIDKSSRKLLKVGDVSLLRFGSDEIHSLDNFNDLPAVEIHVYGKDLAGLSRVRFDEVTQSASFFMSPKYDNC